MSRPMLGTHVIDSQLAQAHRTMNPHARRPYLPHLIGTAFACGV